MIHSKPDSHNTFDYIKITKIKKKRIWRKLYPFEWNKVGSGIVKVVIRGIHK